MIYPFLKACMLTLSVISCSVFAHFQLLYTPDLLLDKGGPLTLVMPFTHPGSNGAMMAIDKPEAFYRITPKGKEDLLNTLTSIKFTSNENTAAAFKADVMHRMMGDYTYVFIQSPYFDDTQEGYIKQFAKTVINLAGMPTGWGDPLGLPIEIVPFQLPYMLYAPGSFTGQVLAEGKPVPHAEIEVELINYKPDLQAMAFAKTPTYAYPSEHFATLTLKADSQGVFTVGLPKSGIWGIMGTDPSSQMSYKGKPLSQEAVLWIQTKSLGG